MAEYNNNVLVVARDNRGVPRLGGELQKCTRCDRSSCCISQPSKQCSLEYERFYTFVNKTILPIEPIIKPNQLFIDDLIKPPIASLAVATAVSDEPPQLTAIDCVTAGDCRVGNNLDCDSSTTSNKHSPAVIHCFTQEEQQPHAATTFRFIQDFNQHQSRQAQLRSEFYEQTCTII